jgi:hypothetical protein
VRVWKRLTTSSSHVHPPEKHTIAGNTLHTRTAACSLSARCWKCSLTLTLRHLRAYVHISRRRNAGHSTEKKKNGFINLVEISGEKIHSTGSMPGCRLYLYILLCYVSFGVGCAPRIKTERPRHAPSSGQRFQEQQPPPKKKQAKVQWSPSRLG